MAISTRTMTTEQMKSVVIEYFKRFDRGGDVLALFADDADVYFPKWGVARGKDEIARCFGDVAQLFNQHPAPPRVPQDGRPGRRGRRGRHDLGPSAPTA